MSVRRGDYVEQCSDDSSSSSIRGGRKSKMSFVLKKSSFINNSYRFFRLVSSEESRYQNICHQLTILSQQTLEEMIKKSTNDDVDTKKHQNIVEKKNVFVFVFVFVFRFVDCHRRMKRAILVIVEQVKDNRNTFKFNNKFFINELQR